MNKLTFLLLAGLIAGLLESCAPTRNIKGDGNVVTRTIPVGPYDALEVKGGNIILNYSCSDADEGLEVRTDQNILDMYELIVDDGTLKIQPKKEYRRNVNFRPTEFVVTSSSRALERLDIAGAVEANVNSPLWTEDFKVDVAGSGNVQFHDTTSFASLKLSISGSGDIVAKRLACGELKGDIAGSGELTLGGSVEEGKLSTAGSGKMRAFDCRFDRLNYSIAGSGDVEVSVESELKVSIAGSGSVKYKGQPEVNQSIAGSGKIERVE